MTEFDNMMKALVDEKEVPQELNLKLKKKIRAKYKYNKLVRSVPLSAVACIAVGIVLVSAVNQNEEKFIPPQQIVSETIISEEIYVEKEPEPVAEKKIIENKKEDVKKPVNVETKQTEPVDEPVDNGIAVAQIEPLDLYEDEPLPISEDGVPMSRGRMIEEDDAQDRSMSLIEYLLNDEEKVSLVSQKIIEQMENNRDIDYYAFYSIIGNERYDVTEENELVIFFDAGVVASEEFGEQAFNVGVIE